MEVGSWQATTRRCCVVQVIVWHRENGIYLRYGSCSRNETVNARTRHASADTSRNTKAPDRRVSLSSCAAISLPGHNSHQQCRKPSGIVVSTSHVLYSSFSDQHSTQFSARTVLHRLRSSTSNERSPEFRATTSLIYIQMIPYPIQYSKPSSGLPCDYGALFMHR